jgi:hypothetical protein
MQARLKLANLLNPAPEIQCGYCQCGCGGKTGILKRSSKNLGLARGEPAAYIRGHQRRIKGQAYAVEDRGYLSPCWMWLRQTVQGYPSINIDHVNVYVHRALYENKHGPIPPKARLDHLCRQRACINPDHLEAVTNRENVFRMYVAMVAKALAEELEAGGGVYTDLFALYGIRVEEDNA